MNDIPIMNSQDANYLQIDCAQRAHNRGRVGRTLGKFGDKVRRMREEQQQGVSSWVEEEAHKAREWREQQQQELSGWIEEEGNKASEWREEQQRELSGWIEEKTKKGPKDAMDSARDHYVGWLSGKDGIVTAALAWIPLLYVGGKTIEVVTGVVKSVHSLVAGEKSEDTTEPVSNNTELGQEET
jgi:hypothetical protein